MKKYDRSFRTVMPNKRKQLLSKEHITTLKKETWYLFMLNPKGTQLEHFISFAQQGPFKVLKKKTFVTSWI